MIKGFEDTTEVLSTCSTVIIALMHIHGATTDDFEEFVELLKKNYKQLPSQDIVKSMAKYDLV